MLEQAHMQHGAGICQWQAASHRLWSRVQLSPITEIPNPIMLSSLRLARHPVAQGGLDDVLRRLRSNPLCLENLVITATVSSESSGQNPMFHLTGCTGQSVFWAVQFALVACGPALRAKWIFVINLHVLDKAVLLLHMEAQAHDAGPGFRRRAVEPLHAVTNSIILDGLLITRVAPFRWAGRLFRNLSTVTSPWPMGCHLLASTAPQISLSDGFTSTSCFESFVNLFVCVK